LGKEEEEKEKMERKRKKRAERKEEKNTERFCSLFRGTMAGTRKFSSDSRMVKNPFPASGH